MSMATWTMSRNANSAFIIHDVFASPFSFILFPSFTLGVSPECPYQRRYRPDKSCNSSD